jgi:hypothetical protein
MVYIQMPFSRCEVKTMRLPSGDRVASASYPSLFVRGATMPVRGSARNMSYVAYRGQTYPFERSGAGGGSAP